MTKSTKVCDQAIAVCREALEALRACKTDDVIYAILENNLAVCLDPTGKHLHLGSPIHAAPAAEVSKVLKGNTLRNGNGFEARPMLRQIAIACAIDEVESTIAKFAEWTARQAVPFLAFPSND